MTIVMLGVALAAMGPATSEGTATMADGSKSQKILFLSDKADAAVPHVMFEAEHGLVSNEALVALTVNRAMRSDPDFATPEALRSSAGYRSAPIRDADNSHLAGAGFVTQDWDSGADAQTQGATSMTAHYSVFGSTLTFTTGD
ncbi:hypothetical protein [Allosphingosinicella vermicomposti]|uniref:hypothetical protein n=1 Tax=Allosphingosinicella vermicomposti TaxID=614671 RepID=UPI000D112D62|nr:hypothetical protein [Allosphingosinicella vermicomposti]